MDYRMLLTYIIVDIFCIVIVGVIYRNLTSDSGSEQEVTVLKYSLLYYMLFMIAGLIGLILENGSLIYSKAVDYLANIVSLSSLALSGFFWFVFVQLRTNKKFIASRWKIFAYIPMGIVVFLCVSTPLTGWVFYIDQDNCYKRGSLFLLISIIPLIYDFAASVIAYVRGFQERQIFRKKQYYNLGSFSSFRL